MESENMPEPKQNEKHSPFIERCIPIVLKDGTAKNSKQAVAVCNSMWEDAHKSLHTVKILAQDDDTMTVGGYGVIFGGMDLTNETFTKDTDLMLDLVPRKIVLYDLAMSKEVKQVIGYAKEKVDDVGVWVEAQLDKSKQYVDGILELVEKGVLGWSSGSVSHLVEIENKFIRRWPIVEYSLTPTPAEPRTLGVEVIKKLAETNPDLKALLPEEPGDGSATATETIVDATNMTIEHKTIQLKARAWLALTKE